MAVIKAKNTAGEWVNVASAEATTITNDIMGTFNSVNISVPYGTETNTLDLSEYINPGNDFFIILGVTSSRNQGTEQLFAWWKKDGKVRTIRGAMTTGLHASFNDIFPKYSGTLPLSYDDATGILTMDDDTYKYIENAVLFYAGIKEA